MIAQASHGFLCRWRTTGGHDETSDSDKALRGAGPRDQNQSRALPLQQGQGQAHPRLHPGAAEEQGPAQAQDGPYQLIMSVCLSVSLLDTESSLSVPRRRRLSGAQPYNCQVFFRQLPQLKAMNDPSEYNINTALKQLDEERGAVKGERLSGAPRTAPRPAEIRTETQG